MTTELGANTDRRQRLIDTELRRRAHAVVPNGMYGHLNMGALPAIPQYIARSRGARLWDVDGNEYVDLMCSWGPVILGHADPAVEEAAERQQRQGDCLNGPGPVMVELAEAMVRTVSNADWVMFAKNGTDATTMCCTIARAATGRSMILVAEGAYHGAAPWCTPFPAGVTAADRANLLQYQYNDVTSIREAVGEHAGDVAAIIVSPFRHDAGFDQELVDPSFARGVRAYCDEIGAALILDDVRAGFRLHHGHSWEPLGVHPDLTPWSKAIANGYPLAAVTGSDRYRDAAGSIFVTGSFWMGAVAMAACLATLDELVRRDAVARMRALGLQLRAGVVDSAAKWGFDIRYTGPAQMPNLLFDNDTDYELAVAFSAEAQARGVYVHPKHNWFVSSAMSADDLDMALTGLDGAFAALRARYPRGTV
ncbi:aminotransferase class III-fold pyridoxal phosphate-dependent enzyme [Mycobacterium sp. 236(2023)]|uniref:aminotransferase class III-fold pyridoxal phosphate-dependent enzyme n=1 Tax=Mycobacterium sp. 236(2023) TaxID=3038163 RepID=UPI002414F9CF|nr:aminotransferase class III-fold pyridoxal phosphate-dependent enzyme [Mycobacterium sp. 236(2023)]MDG4667184.1 aminotransferase class III-fold pyridoxal phosphate-dependent enzyme [Mycobacterium sp. 236(2023)]